MPSYLITLAEHEAAKLEQMLGGRVEIVPSTGTLDEVDADPERAVIAGLDAVTYAETKPIRRRLSTRGPLYHVKGPG